MMGWQTDQLNELYMLWTFYYVFVIYIYIYNIKAMYTKKEKHLHIESEFKQTIHQTAYSKGWYPLVPNKEHEVNGL